MTWPGTPARRAPLPGDEVRARVRAELVAAAEVLGLTSLAFARPVLDAFGRSPETFLARDADRLDLLLFALAVALAPVTIVSLGAAATRLAGPRARAAAHVVVIGVLAAAVVYRFGSDASSWATIVILAAAVAGAVAVSVARLRFTTTATYLRLLGVASVLFVVQFLAFSPTSDLVGRDVRVGDEHAAAAVRAATDGAPPPIVVVVVDAMSTTSLLDGTGRIDGELYPNLAALADDATWYRNHTTVSPFTFQAVPALLTGQRPRDGLPDAGTYPDNLFTLFGGTHDIHAVEQITRLCPTSLCPPDGSSAVGDLLGDATEWWQSGVEEEVASGAQLIPEVIESDRGENFTDWVGSQDFAAGGDPGLWFYHVVLPHEPWTLVDDGSSYEEIRQEPYGSFLHTAWEDTGPQVAQQRHLLQTRAVDGMLGELVDRLEAAGTYDDALVVVAGDHGQAFVPGEPWRGLSEGNYEHVAWTPLLVKAPQQGDGVVDDRNISSVDLLPTLAGELGVDLDWDIDGSPAAGLPAGSGGTKRVLATPYDELKPAPGSEMVELDAGDGLARLLTTDLTAAGGADALWRRTEHDDLLGRSVDHLTRGAPAGDRLTVERLDRIEHPGDDLPMLEVIAPTGLDQGAVALAVNDTVAAVAPVTPSAEGAGTVVHALLMPDAFDADNELTAYAVEGPVGDETLHPLTVTEG